VIRANEMPATAPLMNIAAPSVMYTAATTRGRAVVRSSSASRSNIRGWPSAGRAQS